MGTRSKGISAGFGWLSSGIGVGFRHPKPLFGGAAIVGLMALIPTFITLPIQFHAAQSGTPLPPTYMVWATLFSMLFGLLLLPLYAGYLQTVDAAERGLAARASDVFKPYLEGKALRFIGFGLVMLLVYIAVFAALIAATGGGIAHWYVQAITAQANHLPPPTAMPPGFWTVFLLGFVLCTFMMGVYSISLGQLTLGNRSVFGAVGDGLIGALKNILPLLMLLLGFIIVGIIAAICFFIAALLLAFIGKLIATWMMFVLLVPLYIALILTMFTVMFGVMYHMWRDVCDGDNAMRAAEAIAA